MEEDYEEELDEEYYAQRNFFLTTIDNPFNPVTEWEEWYMFDLEKGYNSCGKIARIAKYSEDMTLKEEFDETERAINRLIEIDPLDMYRKVYTSEETEEMIEENVEE